MMTQNDIAEYFKLKHGTRINQVRISRMLTGNEQISWPFAKDLSNEFPGKTIQQWKNATPEDLKRAFEQLKTDGEAA